MPLSQFFNDRFVGPVMDCSVQAAQEAAVEADVAAATARAFTTSHGKARRGRAAYPTQQAARRQPSQQQGGDKGEGQGWSQGPGVVITPDGTAVPVPANHPSQAPGVKWHARALTEREQHMVGGLVVKLMADAATAAVRQPSSADARGR
ncbi:hypothetical protein QJQ45_021983 [Haematococcus lacustris]|nr:hypothetical protein QJQ45_021983 [Haematococcus lacustris]